MVFVSSLRVDISVSIVYSARFVEALSEVSERPLVDLSIEHEHHLERGEN